jgi:hypothetical protein
MADELFETLVSAIQDVQSGLLTEGLQQVAAVIDEVLKADLGPYGIGVLEVRVGILEIQTGQPFAIEEGIASINEGLHDLILVSGGSDYERGLNELHDGLHAILAGDTDQGFQNVYTGLQDLAEVVAQTDYYDYYEANFIA